MKSKEQTEAAIKSVAAYEGKHVTEFASGVLSGMRIALLWQQNREGELQRGKNHNAIRILDGLETTEEG